MVSSWEKYIRKHPLRNVLFAIIADIAANKLDLYDVKKLGWYTDLYRVRKWKIRIVFRLSDDGNEIVAVDSRWDVYKNI